MLTIVRRSLGRASGLFAGVACVLAAFQVALVAVATSFASRNDFERLASLLPAGLQGAFGPSLRSFGGMSSVGYFEPIPVLLVVLFAVYVASEPAGDIETRLVDLVLARPQHRSVLITRTIVVVALLIAGLLVTMTAALYAGLWWIAPAEQAWPAARAIAHLTVNLGGIAAACAAVSLVVAASSSRRAAACGPVAIGMAGAFLLEVLTHSWEPALRLAWLSPFHYFPGPKVLDGTVQIGPTLGVLAAITAVAVASAYWQFSRRDL